MDLCKINDSDYLIVVDYLSRFPEVARLPSTRADVVIERLKSIFARHGAPEIVISDNGPQYSSSELKTFASKYGFFHVTTSPRYPQANGEVERIMLTVKRLIRKLTDSYLAILGYKVAPGLTGRSAAEILIGRRLRTRVPMLPKFQGQVRHELETVIQKDRRKREKQRRGFNKPHRATEIVL